VVIHAFFLSPAFSLNIKQGMLLLISTKKKFEGSWRSWSEVDKDTKKMWFEEFKVCDNLYNIYL